MQETHKSGEPAFLKHCLCLYGLFYCEHVVLLTCKILSRDHLTHLGDIYVQGCQSPTQHASLLELCALLRLRCALHLAVGTACFRFNFTMEISFAFKWHCERTCIVGFQCSVLLLYCLLHSMQRLLSCSARLFLLADAEQAAKLFQHHAITKYKFSICSLIYNLEPHQLSYTKSDNLGTA